MDIRFLMPLLLIMASARLASAWEYRGKGDYQNNSPHPTDREDLPEFLQDWGYPTTQCQDIWTLCGTWNQYDKWHTYPSVCCRSMGKNKGIVCRHPSQARKEFSMGFSNLHKTYCLPIFDSYTHWGNSRGAGGMAMNDMTADVPYNPRGDSGVLVNQEVVEQLTRIADALDAKKP